MLKLYMGTDIDIHWLNLIIVYSHKKSGVDVKFYSKLFSLFYIYDALEKFKNTDINL